MKVLCVSHSSRPFFEARCTVNAFEQRFGDTVGSPLTPFEQLSGVNQAVPFRGALTLWEIIGGDDPKGLRFLRSYEPEYKVQSAVFHGDRLLVHGSDRLELLDPDFRVERTIRDPWLVGGHTIFVDASGFAWVSASPANAALRIDLQRGEVIERLLMPAAYGRHYELTPKSDLHAHYVPTDLQETHLNCVYPVGQKVLVTLLRQGAIGEFDQDRSYREIARGFRGCHGGKLEPTTGEIMFADSPTGIVWFLDAASGRVRRRIDLQCRWLHDAHPLGAGNYAVTVADHNAIRVVSNSGAVRCEADASPFGESVMFVSAAEVTPPWRSSLELPRPRPKAQDETPALGPELLPDFEVPTWTLVSEVGAEVVQWLRSRQPLRHEYLWMSNPIDLEPGRYELAAELEVAQGGFMMGLLDVVRESWLGTASFDVVTSQNRCTVTVVSGTATRVVFAANNAQRPLVIEASVVRVSLRRHLPEPTPPTDGSVA